LSVGAVPLVRPLALPCLNCFFPQDRLRQNSQISWYFWRVGVKALGSMMGEQREFGAAEVTGFQVLFDQRSHHWRQLFRTKRKQGRRRRTRGRFSECELYLCARHFFQTVSPVQTDRIDTLFQHFSQLFLSFSANSI